MARPTVAAALALLVCLSIVPVALAATDDPPVHPPPPAPRLGAPEIFGYYVYWDLDAYIDYEAITTVAYFGLDAGADGLIERTGEGATQYSRWKSAKVTEAIEAAHAADVRFVLTLERMAWTASDMEATRALLSDPARRASLIADVVAEVQDRGVDGISLDFEPILTDQLENFAAFVHDLRTALDEVDPMYQLTFATPGSQSTAKHKVFAQLTETGAADAVIIMGYPLRSNDALYAGGMAPMKSATSYDLTQVLNAYLKWTAPERIVLALPWYGRKWPTTTPELNAPVQPDKSLYGGPATVVYAGAVELARRHGRLFDPVERSAWVRFRGQAGSGGPETWFQVYYDDVDAFAYKVDWITSLNLAGVGIFALGYDDDERELWTVLRLRHRGLVDVEPPIGSVSIGTDDEVCTPAVVRVNLSATDGDGSGVAFVRLSGMPGVGADGSLVSGLTYPQTPEIDWPLHDPALGGGHGPGPRTIHAQWRDVAGNWSDPVALTVAGTVSCGPIGTLEINGGASLTNSATLSVSALATSPQGTIAAVRLASSPSLTDGVLAGGATFTPEPVIPWTLPAAPGSSAPADGSHTVYAQWQDSLGVWSPVVSASITLDRTAPQIGAPSASVNGSTLGPGGVPVTVRWQASDALSGLASVSLEASRDGGAWTQLAEVAGLTQLSTTIDTAASWRFRIGAKDAAGNSATATGPALRATLIQDDAGVLKYKRKWFAVSDPASSGGSTRYTKKKRGVVKLAFIGSSVSWVAPTGPSYGKAKVIINGKLAAKIDLGGQAADRQIVFTRAWAKVGAHKIKIKGLRTKGRPRIDLDAFLILGV